MLYAAIDKSQYIRDIVQQENGLLLVSEKGRMSVAFTNAGCVRIIYTEKETFAKVEYPGLVESFTKTDFSYEVYEDTIILHTNLLRLMVDRQLGKIAYYDASGKLLLQEKNGKSLEEYQTYRILEDSKVHTRKIQTADGIKEVVTDAERVPDKVLYHTRLSFDWQEDEVLYGLGQQEEGIGNLRGHTVYLHQANRKIAIPMLLSNRGYGILMNADSPMIFNDNEFGSYWYTQTAEELDYYFLYGGSMDGVVRRYREVTGKAAMLPKWAFGYLQSQERYETAEELIQVAQEYRKRGIGLDALVLDWCSWEDGMWGQKTFDAKRFPNPRNMIDSLHEEDVHFMISIWPNMDEKCDNYQEMKQADMLLTGSSIYNALSPKGRELYWKQVERGLFQYGVDAWWCDSSEPVTPEWSHRERVEPAVMYNEYCRDTDNLFPAGKGNAYALYHAKSLYEGQRKSGLFPEKRVVNLTRSAWTGQQRYGTILWSGDVDASWNTLRKQVAAGIHFCASGLPYWTTDIGAFFVKNSCFWYWKGDYNDTTQDAGYRELFTRWYQWGAFLPIFRGHGTDCRRELWMFGTENGNPAESGDVFYQSILAANRKRYELMPYLYSTAGKVWLEDGSMMRHLAFDFPEDHTAAEIFDQYLLGESLMICPVTEAMYYGPGSKPLEGRTYTRRVYLPKDCNWYDYESGAYYEGGQWIEAQAPIEKIPVYVKEGSILPLTTVTDRVQADEQIQYVVFAGKDAETAIYRDAGDGYGYEKGEYEYTHFRWNNETGILSDADGQVYEPLRVVKTALQG